MSSPARLHNPTANTMRRALRALSSVLIFSGVLLLLGVEIAGVVGMGAKRWLDLGIVRVGLNSRSPRPTDRP